MTLVLIDDAEAMQYADLLRPQFPDLTICTAEGAELGDAPVEDAEIIITFGYRFDERFAERAKRLRWVQALSTGTDHFQRALARRPEVLLTSARGIHGLPVAEYTLMAMLALARRLPELLERQRQQCWDRQIGTLIAGKKVAIAGMGVIGREIARRCKAFDMFVIGLGSEPRHEADVDEFHTYDHLATVARDVDFLVIVTPLTERTRGMFDRTIFGAMPKSAFVINVGRGATVVEEDLIEALQSGAIAGAALDAFVQEPLPPNSEFWTQPNVIATPHIAGAHDEYLQSVVEVIRHNLSRFVAGDVESMMNIVPRGAVA